MLFGNLSSKAKIIGDKSHYHKIVEIISNTLLLNKDYSQQIPIIIDFIDHVYEKYNDSISRYVTETILKQIWQLFSIENLTSELIEQEILRIVARKTLKMNYFRD